MGVAALVVARALPPLAPPPHITTWPGRLCALERVPLSGACDAARTRRR